MNDLGNRQEIRHAGDPQEFLRQVALSLVLMIVSTITAVWAAGRIFRIGLLVQGKSATFAQMIRWVAAK